MHSHANCTLKVNPRVIFNYENWPGEIGDVLRDGRHVAALPDLRDVQAVLTARAHCLQASDGP